MAEIKHCIELGCTKQKMTRSTNTDPGVEENVNVNVVETLGMSMEWM